MKKNILIIEIAIILSILFVFQTITCMSQNRDEMLISVPVGHIIQLQSIYSDCPIPNETESFKEGKVSELSYSLQIASRTNNFVSKVLFNRNDNGPADYNVENKPQNGNAVLSVFFFGLELNNNCKDMICLPSYVYNYSVTDLIRDIITQNGKTIFENCSDTLRLLTISKETVGDKVWEGIFGTEQQMFFPQYANTTFLVWDVKKSPILPSIFSGIYNQTDVLPINPIYQVSIDGTQQRTISYNLISQSGIEPAQQILLTGVTKSFECDKITKLSLNKPNGINLTLKKDDDTTGLLNHTLEIRTITGVSDTVILTPVSYSVIYINPYGGDPQVISNHLDEILVNSDGPILCYLSGKKDKPIIVKDRTEIRKISDQLMNTNFEPAYFTTDLKRIVAELNYAPFQKRMNLNLYLFVPVDIFEENSKNFKIKLNDLKIASSAYKIERKNIIEP
ncbi:MAG: hypothetical protein KGZ82_11200 [Bacteroidales bacterium]|nr:hypothetical protein [Bacteroidales bacterium]